MTDFWFDSVFIGSVGLDLVCGLDPFPLKMERKYPSVHIFLLKELV